MYLLEYRDNEIPLAAGGQPFRIPENIYIIGTMNTADRSIALVDHALRRRFSFIRLQPEYVILDKYLKKYNLPADSLISALKQINQAIEDPNYAVGISFFMKDQERLKQELPLIWKTEIEPYLEEYFYDQPSKVESFRWDNLVKGVLKDWIL
jgi:5-methylcytosine-specific restriction protein B